MINEINLRTNCNEYTPGDDIYGVVYLRIVSPTSGRGVSLRFYGYEEFVYEYKTDDDGAGEKQKYQAFREYINYDVILYETDEPLQMCNTLFPFQMKLPSEIPGTFEAFNETDCIRWEATVKYKLEASVIDATRYLKMSQDILILENIPRGMKAGDLPVAVSVTYQKTTALIFTSVINFTTRLFHHTHRSGENARLRVMITNNSSIKVQSMKIRLLRSIILTCPKQALKKSQNTALNITTEADNEWWDKVVESRKSVIRPQHIQMLPFQKGFDNIQLPLKDTADIPIMSTVNGQYIKCRYDVHIEVALSNGDTFDVEVPVTAIWPERNNEWSKWHGPDWVLNQVPNMNIHHTDSVLHVPENLLATPAFSNIPGFHPK